MLIFRHLSEDSDRETFESAHSVILAIFASHAQRQQRQSAVLAKSHVNLQSVYSEDIDFVKRMVPFYARCLIEVRIPPFFYFDGASSIEKAVWQRLHFFFLSLCSGNVPAPSLASLLLTTFL
jgi:hypothetical protein